MDLMKKLQKVDKGEMSKEDISAKLDVLKELYEAAMGMMGDKVKGDMDSLKSVSVMSDDDESLREGLDLAEGLLDSEMEDEEESEEHDLSSLLGEEEEESEDTEEGLDLLSEVSKEDEAEEDEEAVEPKRKTKIKFY